MKTLEDNLEDRLKEYFQEEEAALNDMDVPEEMETRLKEALTRKQRKRSRPMGMIASLVIVLMLFTYNFDAVAYYGKKILGFESVMYGTMQDLNEMGKGQVIGKSYTFKNDVKVTLDGVMVDENQLLTFFTLSDEKGRLNYMNLHYQEIKGLIQSYNPSSGRGKANHQWTEQKWVASFEPPAFYEKNLTFNFQLMTEKVNESGSIDFELDRTKAMGYQIKENIGKTFKIKGNVVRFAEITASPTLTVIRGTIDVNPNQAKVALRRRAPIDAIVFELYADGEKVNSQGGGFSSNGRQIEFESEFDALPEGLEKIEIKLLKLAVFEDISKKISVDKNATETSIDILGQELLIKNIRNDGEDVYVTLSGSENLAIGDMVLTAEDKSVKATKTVSDDLKKTREKGILREWTVKFPGAFINTGRVQLEFNGIIYLKNVNKVIQIPVG